MTTTTVYYASNNEKQPNRFQLVIGSCSYELPKIEIYEILECVASAYGYQKEPFIEEQTECFVKGNPLYTCFPTSDDVDFCCE